VEPLSGSRVDIYGMLRHSEMSFKGDRLYFHFQNEVELARRIRNPPRSRKAEPEPCLLPHAPSGIGNTVQYGPGSLSARLDDRELHALDFQLTKLRRIRRMTQEIVLAIRPMTRASVG
jgi:hypothetical protein